MTLDKLGKVLIKKRDHGELDMLISWECSKHIYMCKYTSIYIYIIGSYVYKFIIVQGEGC